MPADASWHTLMEAARRDDRDKMPGYVAAGGTRTLTPPGAPSGFTSRGASGAERAARFAQKIKAAGPGADDLAGQFLTSPGSKDPACCTGHVNTNGLAGRVNEHAAMPGLAA